MTNFGENFAAADGSYADSRVLPRGFIQLLAPLVPDILFAAVQGGTSKDRREF